jgi:hypothetical protein
MAGTAVTVASPGRVDGNPELENLREQHNNVITDLETIRTMISEFSASDTFDVGSIADGNFASKDITVTGAALGDFVTGVSVSLDLQDMYVTAQVTAANTVTVTICNETGGALDILTPTIQVRTSSPGIGDAAGDLVAATVNA